MFIWLKSLTELLEENRKKAAKQVRNMSRQKPKGVIEKPKDGTRTFPKSHIITLDDLTKPD